MSYQIEPETINAVYPISRITRYQSGYLVERDCKLQSRPTEGRGTHKIKKLSKRSLSRLAFTAKNTSVQFASLLTLTYPSVFPTSGKEVKAHLNKFLVYSKRAWGKYEYLWFLEFQKRGAPHIHMAVTLPEPDDDTRKRFSEIWSHICTVSKRQRKKVYKNHMRKEMWERIKSPHGISGYVLKYALKPEQKIVPKQFQDVGAFWRTSKAVRPKPMAEPEDITEGELREILGRMGHRCAHWDVIPKYILIGQ